MIQLNNSLKATFDELVATPYQMQKYDQVWQQKVLTKDDTYQRKTILKQGRADFINGESGLTPEQTVLLYCRHYLQMHLASSCYLFDVCTQELFDGTTSFLQEDTLMIDFGCGPLTSALALALYSQQINNQILKLNYIGIDHAPAMLNKAQEFSKNKRLFRRDSPFEFLNDYKNYDIFINFIRKHRLYFKESWIILNFSYVFASSSLDYLELSYFVNQLLQQFPHKSFLILFQNPPISSLNVKWNQFKKSLDFPFYNKNDNVCVHYREYPIHLKEKNELSKPPINLYYEILSR